MKVHWWVIQEGDMQLTEQTDNWTLVMEAGRLSYIHIDFRLGLDVTDASSTVIITIERRCVLSSPVRESVLIPSEPTTLGPILQLFNVDVGRIEIQKMGLLKIDLGNSYSLRVDPDEKYEAWQIGCPTSDFLFVCFPGGEVSLFQKQKG
jgi:hypothetical protein